MALAVALVACLALASVGERGPLARLEGSLLDLRFRLRPARPAENRIVVLAIDNASIAAVGRWPWPRAVFARLLDRLAQAPPKLIAFDLLFTEPEPSGDAEFARAMAAAPVLLAFATTTAGGTGAAGGGLADWLGRFEYGRVLGDPSQLPEAAALMPPVAVLGQAASGLGHVTLIPDATGAFREDYPVIRIGSGIFPSLALEAARAMRDVPRHEVMIEPGQGIELGPLGLLTDSRMRLVTEADPPGRIPVIPVGDVLAGRVPGSALAGRLVLIGATATGLGDHVPSPFDPALPGVLRNAAAISGLLDGRVIRDDEVTLLCGMALILAACLAVGLAARRSARAGLLAAAAMCLVLLAADLLAFDLAGWWLNATVPLVAVMAAAAGIVWAYQRQGARTIHSISAAARHDALTGLANRAGLRAWVEAAGDARQLVCAADLDGFKRVNDTLGHAAGDEVLREVAARLMGALPPGDLACRLGGDEFVLVLRAPEGTDAAAEARARDALALVGGAYALAAGPAQVGMSMGVAIWPDDAAAWSRVLALADAALYAAKRAGKGQLMRAPKPAAREVEL